MAVTYDDLLTRTPDQLYAQNRSLVDAMPTIVAQAEEQLHQILDHDLFQTRLTGLSLTVGDPLLDLTGQAGLLDVRAVRVQYHGASYVPLERRNLEMLSMLYTDDRPGIPRFYSDYGDTNILRVFPVPRQTYAVEVTANVLPPALGPSTQSNVIALKYGRALERAVFRQAAIFMKNKADEERFNAEMAAAVGEANAAIARRRRDDTDVRPRETANAKGA